MRLTVVEEGRTRSGGSGEKGGKQRAAEARGLGRNQTGGDRGTPCRLTDELSKYYILHLFYSSFLRFLPRGDRGWFLFAN